MTGDADVSSFSRSRRALNPPSAAEERSSIRPIEYRNAMDQIDEARAAGQRSAEALGHFVKNRMEELARQRDALESQLDAAETQLTIRRQEVTSAKARLSQAAKQDADRQRRIHRLEVERSRLRDRLAVANWKLQSQQRRRWWRLGAALGSILRSPSASLV